MSNKIDKRPKPDHDVPNGYCFYGDPKKDNCEEKDCRSAGAGLGSKHIVLFAKKTKTRTKWICGHCARQQRII